MRSRLWVAWLLVAVCLAAATASSIGTNESPCDLVGCAQCHSDGAECLACLDESWVLKDGMCECTVGTGTHVQSAEPLEGWPTVPPKSDDCRVWNDDHRTAVMSRWRKLGGQGPKPGPAPSLGCTCSPCPAGWTSLGGSPEQAMCYPTLESTRRLFPIPTPGPPPIKTPYKGFYKDLASISNYIGSITVSWGKSLDQQNKATFDLLRTAKIFGYSSVNGLFSKKFTKDNLGTLVDKGIALNFRQFGRADEEGSFSLLKRNQLAWEGKLIKNVMSFTSALSIIFSIVDIVSSMTTKDPTQAKLDFLVETTNQINQTVTETLERVKFVQDKIDRIDEILRTISQQLELILTEIQNTQCYISNSNVDAVWTQRLKPLWFRYTIGEGSLAKRLSATAINFLEKPTSPLDRDVYEEALAWARDVRDTTYADLDSIHAYLVDSTTPGALTLCSTAFYSKWANNRASAYPFDDRQYFYPITNFLIQKTLYQVNGMQMLREAYTLLAMDEVRLKALETNETAISYFGADADKFCELVLAKGANTSHVLYAGYALCGDIEVFGGQVYDNMVQQIETMGQPFSQGGEGEGVRLLIGGDLAPYQAAVPQNYSDAGNQSLTSLATTTRWLFPASLVEFDARCNSSNVDEALAAGCPAVGTFRSCTDGCQLDPAQEALWAALPDTILGMARATWTVADGGVWQEVRGMLTGFQYFNNKTGPADTFIVMETPPLGSYASAFKQMSDRPWWIINQTAAVRMSDLVFDSLPVFKSFALNTENVYYRDNGGRNLRCSAGICQDAFALNGACREYYSDERFDFNPHELQVQAQCFAASNPDSSADSIGQRAGPTGVFCSSTDFAALFNQTCQEHTDATPCCLDLYPAFLRGCVESKLLKKNCTTRMKPSLLAKFGTSLAPSQGKAGDITSMCSYRLGTVTRSGFSEWYGVPIQHFVGNSEGFCGLSTPENQVCFDSVDSMSPRTYGACSPQFIYPWFGNETATYRPWKYGSNYRDNGLGPAEPIPGWTLPNDSATRRLFRLPVSDISKMVCTPSPFITAGHENDPNELRPRRNSAGFIIPCNDLMTQAVVAMIGSGFYTARSYGDTATLKLADDGDTLSCDVHWASAAYTTQIYITVRDGPIYDTDDPAFTNDPNGPVWVTAQVSMYNSSAEAPQQLLQNVSLRTGFTSLRTNRTSRVVGCTVVGSDVATGLPISLSAVSKVLFNVATTTTARALAGSSAWQDFSYPIYTKPCLTKGCISTVLSDVPKPTWLAVGRATNWPGRESRNDTVFVAGPAGLWQLGPADGSDLTLVDAINNASAASSDVFASFYKQDPTGVTGFAVDARGALLLAGARSTKGANESSGGVLALSPWVPMASSFPLANTSFLGNGANTFTCLPISSRSAARLGYLSLDGAWRHPGSGDVYVVDGGCGFLYRLEAAALDTSCVPFGSCGRMHFMADLGTTANLTVDEASRQNVSLAGDVQRGLLYAGYGSQCAIMRLNLTTGQRLNWAVAATLTDEDGPVTLPLCGYAGDGGLALGGLAALSSDIRQLVVDSATGDLYIADTGNFVIRMVEAATGILRTVVGVGQGGYTGDGGLAALALLWEPSGLALVEVRNAGGGGLVGGFYKYLYVADTGNNAVRRVSLSDPSGYTAAPTRQPTTSPPSRAPTNAPRTPRPTRSPTLMPTTNPWNTARSCRDCVTTGAVDGISKLTCQCGNPTIQYEEAVCYSSCCRRQTVVYDGEGVLSCQDLLGGRSPCTAGDDKACPVGWTGPYDKLCRDCFQEEVPGHPNVVRLTCRCGGLSSFVVASCNSNCCPSRTLAFQNGALVCTTPGGTCSNGAGGPCTPTSAPTQRPTAASLAPTLQPTAGPTTAPSKRPSGAPTRAPSQAPTSFTWSFAEIGTPCRNIEMTMTPSGAANFTAQCNGISTSCFSTCCPSGEVYHTPTSSGLVCGPEGGACSVTYEGMPQACPKGWTYPLLASGCTNCFERLVNGERLLTCSCRATEPTAPFQPTSCYADCCPSKSVQNVNGTLVCSDGKECYPADGYPCYQRRRQLGEPDEDGGAQWGNRRRRGKSRNR